VRKLRKDPDNFVPSEPAHLIGPAQKVATNFLMRAKSYRKKGRCQKPHVFYGPSGVGKSKIVDMAVKILIQDPANYSKVPGADIGKSIIEAWIRDGQLKAMFPGLIVKHIDEVDKCSNEAKNLFLTYLEAIPKGWVILATTNATPDPKDAFWSRWIPHHVDRPTDSEIENFLHHVMELPLSEAKRITVDCKGNVRSAYNMAAEWLA
jgi:replication-associated recombination protein RarA